MSTPTEVKDLALLFYSQLSEDLQIDLTIPNLDLDFELNLPTFSDPTDLGGPIADLSISALTDGNIDGTGAFDQLMAAAARHLQKQYDENRITATDYARAYTEICVAVLAQAQEFVTAGMNAVWQARLIRAQTQVAMLQREGLRMEAQTKKVELVRAKIDLMNAIVSAAKAQGEMVAVKMELPKTYQEIQTAEGQATLVSEQVDTARAQTKETLKDGTPVLGIAGKEKDLREAQVALTTEQIDTARGATKLTTLNGDPISGSIAKDMELKEEQIQTQVQQRELILEQIDTQRASTKDTLKAGGPIMGITAQDKLVKTAQVKLVNEQYETQHAQTRGTLSGGETVGGLLGAQTALYVQQKKSYIDDSKTKVVKMMMDSWTARKTIDEGVAVPTQIDTAAIDTSMANLRNSVDIAS